MLSSLLLVAGAALAQPVPEIVVVASQLRESELASLPASVTVLDPESIAAGSVQHFEQLAPLVPNLNWSGDGSRARYFQIRGTGELEQYEGAPNPSVGFIVDDIDLSDIGGVATSFDVGQIEVLRGPQGTRYGANALAGLVYVRTADPVPAPMAEVTVTGGGDGTRALGGVASGPVPGLAEALTYRVAVQQYESDGFRHNAYLGRDDTSGQDEFTARAKLRWAGYAATVQLTAFHVDLDNGYDDFAVDGGFTTFSDKPGEDSQQTDAVALRATMPLAGVAELVSITGAASSDIVYGFDADWGNDEFWSPDVYDFTQRFDRERDTLNQEFRLVSTPGGRLAGSDWIVGAYVLSLEERNRRVDTGTCGASACGTEIVLNETPVTSDYDATSLAFFGEVSRPLGSGTTLAGGLRWEQRAAEAGRFSPRDRMLGGDLSLTRQIRASASVWARIARGYKAGGFNASLVGVGGAEDQLEFQPEYLWNYEVGARVGSDDGRLAAALSVFYQDRDDLQIKVPRQFILGDPTTFLFSTTNAESGHTVGLELEGTWQPVAAPVMLGAALGLLDTAIDRFSTRPELEGRELAHAPRYTFAVNATWRGARGWFVRADYTGKDGYAIDYCQAADCNDPETDAYEVLDLRAGREWGAWSVEAWCRNVLDKEYAVRGFYFGIEPPDFAQALYTRLGDPRHAGVTVKYRL